MVITMSEKMAVIIVDSEKDRHDEYIPCIVKDGEQGYFLTNWRWGKDKDVAQKLADNYNARLGLSKEEVMQLTFESMRESFKKMQETEARLKDAIEEI